MIASTLGMQIFKLDIGEEAAEELGRVYRDAKSLARALSVPVERLAERFEAVQQEQAGLRTDLERAHVALARTLVGAAPTAALPGGVSARLVRVPEAALVTPVLGMLVATPNSLGAVLSADGRCGAASSAADLHAGQLGRFAGVTPVHLKTPCAFSWGCRPCHA